MNISSTIENAPMKQNELIAGLEDICVFARSSQQA
jgi:hypothetical protein